MTIAPPKAPCPKCGYNLRGVEIKHCPECGESFQSLLQHVGQREQRRELRNVLVKTALWCIGAGILAIVVIFIALFSGII